ncbi:CcdB family protein [Azospirillum sp.]|uniref:CcdB family protein n=1 Tax=Azospirillum sp. TaxID=34012 RepID=UPI003D705EFD
MARYDVFANPDAGSDAIFLLDVQSDLLDGLDTRMVVPLLRVVAYSKPARRLHPIFSVAGESVVMATHLMASVHRGELTDRIANLANEHDRILEALDLLFQGF